jgi:hypothetical protein
MIPFVAPWFEAIREAPICRKLRRGKESELDPTDGGLGVRTPYSTDLTDEQWALIEPLDQFSIDCVR